MVLEKQGGDRRSLGCRNSYHNLGGLEQQKLLSQCRGQNPKSALLAVGGNPGVSGASRQAAPVVTGVVRVCLPKDTRHVGSGPSLPR